MSWAKRNLYFLVSCVLAVALLGAAGWFCYSSWQSNSASGEQLSQAYAQLSALATKNPGAGNEKVNNIETAREQAKDIKSRVADVRKFFTPVRSIPNTNHFDDRTLVFAVRDTIAQLRSGAAQHGVTVPVDFAFSFSTQQGKAVYDPKSWDQLSKQLGEVKAICDVIYSCRIASLDAVQRERSADDLNPSQAATQPDYVDAASTTSGNVVISPYQISFRCFSTELGNVLTSFANMSHTMVVKTLMIQPEDVAMMDAGAAATPALAARGGLPVVIDEKKLKVIMLLDFVKTLPEQGR
jgi:hypothetical protein